MLMIILSIGTNIGDRQANIANAITALGQIGKVVTVSPIYTSEPWGFESENGFYNIALILETSLSPLDLLCATQQIERDLGRTAKTTTSYTDRIIDIDIIDYNNQTIDTQTLTLPHKLMHKRNFVLYPLADIAPDWQHPILKLTATELKNASADTSVIHILPQQ
ncbi:MAG: 2-amino-4-hydroxy-6-hydroxymethyldihydropteridine diphosphokinase [Paludibacteraceae bacterium]|nr:2-amino-4-hydroxy-6-hydroxymethyldihydropteridine diphosphokinase [Paludibacteraceae bacterium]